MKMRVPSHLRFTLRHAPLSSGRHALSRMRRARRARGPVLRAGDGVNSITIKSGWTAPVDRYVCVTCGYVASYVSDAADLEDIAANWPKAE